MSPLLFNVNSLTPSCFVNFGPFKIGGIVDSPALFYESIRTLLQESSSAGSVEFHEKSYTLVIKTKLITIPVTWNILMERLESTADVKCQFLVKQIEKLAAFNEELSARVKHLEEINGTPAKVERSLFAAVNLANFTLSGDRKTISKNVGTGNGYQGFLSEHSIAAMGNKFTVALTNMGTNLMVGVARKGTAMAGGIYSKAGSWMLYFNNGQTHSFFANGAAAAAVSTRIAVNNGSQLSVRLDPLNEQIYFRVNGSVIYTADIQLKPYADFFAAVDCYDAGQSLSFV